MSVEFIDDSTTILRITDKALREAYRDNENYVLSYIYVHDGLYAVDVDKMVNAVIVNSQGKDALYILVSSEDFALVDGEEIDFLQLFDVIDITDVEDYIRDASPEEIYRYVSEYELSSRNVDINAIALDMLQDGYTFSDIANDARDIGLIDD